MENEYTPGTAWQGPYTETDAAIWQCRHGAFEVVYGGETAPAETRPGLIIPAPGHITVRDNTIWIRRARTSACLIAREVIE